jgi:hypothetical protein
MVNFFAKFFLFIFVTAISAIVSARKLWSFIDGRIDAEALHLAADIVGPYLGFDTHGDKTQQHNVIQMVIHWVSMPIGIAAGFAVLFVLEIVLKRMQDGNRN